MLTQIPLKHLSLDAIQDSRTWNLHPFLYDIIPEALIQSILKVGILHPPVVVQSGAAYDIVCGRKRIQCAQSLGLLHILCFTISQESSPKLLLEFLLEDQLSSTPLSLPELAHFSKLCLDNFDRAQALAMLPEAIPPRLKARLPSLLEFDYALQKQIHFGYVTDKIIFDLLKLNQEEQRRMGHLIELLQLGGNKQKRLFTLCRDIALRENTSIDALLDQPDIKAVIEHYEMNIPQKTNRFLSLLQKRCYPRSTAAKEHFQSQRLELTLPETCDIYPSPFFEKDEVTLSIRFPDFQTCKRLWLSIKGHLERNREGEREGDVSADS